MKTKIQKSFQLCRIIETKTSVIILQNQPQRVVFGEVVPCPVDKNHQLVADTQDQHQVKEHPDEPGNPSFELHKGEIHHRLVPPDGGHGPQVAVFIRLQLTTAGFESLQVARQVLPLPYRHVGQLGMSPGLLRRLHISHISNGKHILKALHPVEPIHPDPAGAQQ